MNRPSGILDALAEFCSRLGGMSVADLKTHHVSAWLNRDAWNATMQHTRLSLAKSAFEWAVDEELISRNPIRRMRRSKAPSRDFLIDRATHEQLLDGASDHRCRRRNVLAFRTLLIAFRLSGARPGLLREVKVEHVKDDLWIVAKHKTVRKKKRPQVVYCSPCLHTLTRIMAQSTFIESA